MVRFYNEGVVINGSLELTYNNLFVNINNDKLLK